MSTVAGDNGNGAVGSNGFHGVFDNIYKDLFYLASIERNRGDIFYYFPLPCNSFFLAFPAEKFGAALDHLPHRHIASGG